MITGPKLEESLFIDGKIYSEGIKTLQNFSLHICKEVSGKLKKVIQAYLLKSGCKSI